jgi:hypothetical protein
VAVGAVLRVEDAAALAALGRVEPAAVGEQSVGAQRFEHSQPGGGGLKRQVRASRASTVP